MNNIVWSSYKKFNSDITVETFCKASKRQDSQSKMQTDGSLEYWEQTLKLFHCHKGQKENFRWRIFSNATVTTVWLP